MKILNISSSSLLLRSYNSSSLKKIQINIAPNKENTDISLKELKSISKGKNLARENLDATYNSSLNKKFKESLERKLSQLSEIKSTIENKNKKETSISEEEQVTLQDINKKISETNSELKEVRILAEKLSKESEMINKKVSIYKKMHGNDMFKIAEKEAILKHVYDNRNNPLIKELKSTFDEIIELETQLRDKLNKDQAEDKKEIHVK